ncbi:protein of unknown function (plasmid) [Caballeronia sp. S22]
MMIHRQTPGCVKPDNGYYRDSVSGVKWGVSDLLKRGEGRGARLAAGSRQKRRVDRL